MGLQPGNVASTDLQQLCRFQLGQRRLARQPVPQQDQLPFPRRQPLDELPQPPGLVLLLAPVLHAEAVLQHVRKSQGRVILARFQRFLQRDRPAVLALPPEIHPKLVFNAPAGVGGEPRLAGGVEGVHRLHQADGADGDQIFLVAGLGVVFFRHMGHQPQIVPDEFLPRRAVSRPQHGEGLDLLPRGQGLGKAPGLQMQRQHQKLRGEKLQQRQQHSSTSRNSSPIVYVAKWEGSTKRMLCFS